MLLSPTRRSSRSSIVDTRSIIVRQRFGIANGIRPSITSTSANARPRSSQFTAAYLPDPLASPKYRNSGLSGSSTSTSSRSAQPRR